MTTLQRAGIYAQTSLDQEGVAEWKTAREPIEARIRIARRQLAGATGTTALTGFIAKARPPGDIHSSRGGSGLLVMLGPSGTSTC